MKRFITLGKKVYDRVPMSELNITEAMLRYLFEAMFNRPHGEALSEQDRCVMVAKGLIDRSNQITLHGVEILSSCEAIDDCAFCLHFHEDDDGERCLLHDMPVCCGDICEDWEEDV